MNRKKMLPLVLLAAGAVLLGVLLAVLTRENEAEEDTGIPLVDFAAEDVDELAYSGNNVDVTLLKGSEGNWMLDSDPTLPLEQSAVQSLVEKFTDLTAARQLQDSELGEIPAMSDTPAMVFTLKAGKTTRTLTVDQLNDVAGVYYVYDDAGGVYTVAKSDLNNLCKAPRSLYAAQSLTDKTSDDVTALTVGDLQFVLNDGTWQLADDADYALDQSVVKRMVSTLCEMQTEWSITTPEADSAYGLDAPDVTAVLTFADGTQMTMRFGDLVPDAADDTDTGSTTTTSLCYLASDGAPGIVYEVKAAHKDAFAVTKESLLDTSTKETAAADDVVAEH